MSDSERIIELKKFAGLSLRKFAEEIGLNTVQTLYDIKNGKHGISKEVAEKIQAKYLNLNIAWLLTGEGEMLKASDIISDSTSARPFIDTAYAICGKPGGFDISIMERDCEKILLPFVDNYDFSIRAKGESMINRANPQRSIRQGDILACRKIYSFDEVRMGEVYALCADGDIIVKKIAPSSKDGYITCISYNTEEGYLPFDLRINDIYGWALVKGVISVNLW